MKRAKRYRLVVEFRLARQTRIKRYRLGLTGGDHDTGYNLGLLSTESRQFEADLVSHQVLDENVIAGDFVAVWAVVLHQDGLEVGSEGDTLSRLHSRILEADCLDLNDSTHAVDDESIFGSLSVVDPPGEGYARSGTCIRRSTCSAARSATRTWETASARVELAARAARARARRSEGRSRRLSELLIGEREVAKGKVCVAALSTTLTAATKAARRATETARSGSSATEARVASAAYRSTATRAAAKRGVSAEIDRLDFVRRAVLLENYLTAIKNLDADKAALCADFLCVCQRHQRKCAQQRECLTN